jgi:hypothetical protein
LTLTNGWNEEKVKLQKINPGAFIVSAYFNYFIVHPAAQSFRRGYTHIHLFSAVFKRVFFTSQPKQSFFVRREITLY